MVGYDMQNSCHTYLMDIKILVAVETSSAPQFSNGGGIGTSYCHVLSGF